MNISIEKKISTLREQNKLNEIVKILLSENKKSPKNINILFQLAGIFRSIGDFNSALFYYDEVLKIEENFTPAYRMIGTMINHNQNRKYFKKLENLKNKYDLNINQRVDLYFALAKAYDDLGMNDESSNYYVKANKEKKIITKYNSSTHINHLNQIYEIFCNFDFENVQRINTTNKNVIFICGLPRSGSTLVENIISSHNQVYSGGELPYLQRIVKKFFVENNIVDKNKILSHCDDKKESLSSEYFRKISEHNILENTITDKSLANYRWIGLIKLFFNNAKIIICKRNYKSVLSSIYKNDFNSNYYNWTNDPKDIASYIKLYNKLINLWLNKFPNELFEIEYEELVEQREINIKKIIEYCDLDWDPNCIQFYKNKAPIKTASAYQARQPIYSSSVKPDKYLLEKIGITEDTWDI